MLEVVNGVLMIYFLILSLLNVLVPILIKPITACFTRPSNEERTLWGEVLKLRAEQKNLSMKDDFAAYSKLQRKINKLENELKTGSQDRVTKSLAIKSSAYLICQAVLGVMTVISVIWFRNEAIVTLKTNLFPMTSFLSFPNSKPNSISTHIWVIITNVSLGSLLKPITS